MRTPNMMARNCFCERFFQKPLSAIERILKGLSLSALSDNHVRVPRLDSTLNSEENPTT